jgi:raffinose/stachyose/melibiose transport system substrate-binding protein
MEAEMNKAIKRMKVETFALSMVLILAVLLSSCAAPAATTAPSAAQSTTSSPATAPTSAPSTSQEATINILDIHDTDATDKFITDFSAAFEKEHPGVKVVVTTADSGSIDAKRLTLFSAGKEPDIFYSNAGETLNQYVRQGKVAEIENLVDQSLWLPGPLATLTYNGHLYGATKAQNVGGLWYNVGLLKQLNLQPPTSSEELVDVSNKVKAAGNIPFGVGNKEQWPIGIIYDYLTYNYCGQGAREKATFQSDQFTWTDSCFVKAAQKTEELIQAGFFPTGFNGLSNNDAVGLFFNSQAAFTVNGSWLIGISKDAAPQDFQMEFIAWPNPSDAPYPTKDGESILGGADAWAISASSPHKDIAAAWLNEWAKQSPEYNKISGSLPIIPGDEPQDPLLKAIADINAKSQYSWTSGDRVVPSIIAQAWLNNLQSLAGGNMTPEQFAQAMADAVQKNKADLK